MRALGFHRFSTNRAKIESRLEIAGFARNLSTVDEPDHLPLDIFLCPRLSSDQSTGVDVFCLSIS